MTEDARNKELTEAYRDLATESTSADLDDKVLQMAARETRSRYGIARAWVRPVAWAATIGLSLAIVLEVWQVIPPAAEPESAALSEVATEPLSADDSPATPPGGGAAEELGAAQQAPRELPAAKVSRSVELEDADAFAAKDIRILEEAEMQARQRAGEPGIAAFSAISSEAGEAHCDEAARETAESWYECIEALREAGEMEFADSELAALALAFPDFEVPVPSK